MMNLVVAYRGKDKMIQTGIANDGFGNIPVGQVVMADGTVFESDNLLKILKRGYWEQTREFDLGDENAG